MNHTPLPPENYSHSAHETTDVNPFAISLFAIGVGLMIALVMPLLVWIYWKLEKTAKRNDRPQSSVYIDPKITGPKLQAQPAADLAQLRSDEKQQLSNYEWLDQPSGVVQIPIERAIQLLAERGLPEPRGLMPTTDYQDDKK